MCISDGSTNFSLRKSFPFSAPTSNTEISYLKKKSEIFKRLHIQNWLVSLLFQRSTNDYDECKKEGTKCFLKASIMFSAPQSYIPTKTQILFLSFFISKIMLQF